MDTARPLKHTPRGRLHASAGRDPLRLPSLRAPHSHDRKHSFPFLVLLVVFKLPCLFVPHLKPLTVSFFKARKEVFVCLELDAQSSVACFDAGSGNQNRN